MDEPKQGNDPATSLCDAVGQILSHQYLLHEVQHTSGVSGAATRSAVTEPRAHTLIDIYKCLHQGEFGMGHFIGDPRTFEARLQQEIDDNPPAESEPLLESVAKDDAVLRINLRPFRENFAKDYQWAFDNLVKVCLRSAGIEKGTPHRFFVKLASFRHLNNAGQLMVGNHTYRFAGEMVDHFLKVVNKQVRYMGAVPVYSHSAPYRQLNKPSYRVVDLAVLKKSAIAQILEPAYAD